MGVWDVYQDRVITMGSTKRGASLTREQRMIRNKLIHNLSYQPAPIFVASRGFNITPEIIATTVPQEVAIVDSDNLNEKTIFSLPGEDIANGSLVLWMDNYWIVSERDANTTVRTKAKLIQCNHLLRWVSDDDEIMEQWCVIEDGTKYLTGEMEDRWFATTRGDSRISMLIARNEYTVKFGRQNRFLIDDEDSPLKLAYALTKPLKRGWAYNGEGVFKFVLQEVNTTDDDNQDLGIADYYKHFPINPDDDDDDDNDGQTTQDPGNDSGGSDVGGQSSDSSGGEQSGTSGKRVWI